MTPTAVAKVVDQIDALGAADPANADPRSAAARHAGDMADLLSKSSGVSRQDALHWLLHSARGNTLFLRSLGKRLERMKTRKEAAMPYDRMTELRDIVAKADGVMTLAKVMVDDPMFCNKVSEAEFTALVTEQAKRDHPNLRPDAAFAKFFSDPQNAAIRKAHGLINAHPDHRYDYMKVGPPPGPMAVTAPSVTGGEEGSRTRSSTDRDPDTHTIGRVGESAIDQLNALCNAELKRRGLSSAFFARVFTEIYTDPSNAALAMQERRENRPGGVERMAT